jgi:hypothetical protein
MFNSILISTQTSEVTSHQPAKVVNRKLNKLSDSTYKAVVAAPTPLLVFLHQSPKPAIYKMLPTSVSPGSVIASTSCEKRFSINYFNKI